MPYFNAHAARIESGVVNAVIVIPYMDDNDEKITAYCNEIGLSGTWIDTSLLAARRGKFASVGDRYDPNIDEFVPPEQ